VVVSSDGLSEKPVHLSMEEASTVGVPYLAAWSGLVDAANIRSGETVLMTGALGASGRIFQAFVAGASKIWEVLA